MKILLKNGSPIPTREAAIPKTQMFRYALRTLYYFEIFKKRYTGTGISTVKIIAKFEIISLYREVNSRYSISLSIFNIRY